MTAPTLAELIDDPAEARVQAYLDEAEVPEHLPAVRAWRVASVEAWAVTCGPCGYCRLLASKDLAFAVSRLHYQTGEEA